MHNCKETRIKTGESIKLVKKLSNTFFYRLAVCLLYVLYDRSEFINASALDYVHGITGAVTSPGLTTDIGAS